MKLKDCRDWNHYCMPTELYPYMMGLLKCGWYEARFFPECWKEGYTELNSTVPQDVYDLLLEETKKIYLEETGDETYGNYAAKKETIDQYCRYSCNRTQDQYQETVYSCPAVFSEYVRRILERWHYTCNMRISKDSRTAIFASTMCEEIYPFVAERAKMEYLSHLCGDVLYVSHREDQNRGGWTTFMRKYCWHTYFYFLPDYEQYALIQEACGL